jgi:hypothetical protein
MLDFAANPNHYRVSGNGIKTPQPSKNPRMDQSPRLKLRLTVQCEVIQEQDSAIE